MSIRQSPVKEFPGTITLPEHLRLDQCLEWEDMLEAVAEYRNGGGKNLTKVNTIMLPAIENCLLDRSIEGWPKDGDFPGTPRLASAQLLNWMTAEIRRIYDGESEIPNASGPGLTATPETPAKGESPAS